MLRQSEGQEDTIDFCVMLVESRGKLDEAIARRDVEVADSQKELFKKRLQSEALMRNTEIEQKLSDRSVEKRLDLIELRLRRIEEALSNKLDK